MIVFYSGELMNPQAIRAAYPDARFIARASIPVNNEEIATHFAPVIEGTVWGIAVDPGTVVPGEERTATADDGRSLTVALAEPLLGGDPKTVLANAQYWELQPAFVAALKSVIPPGPERE